MVVKNIKEICNVLNMTTTQLAEKLGMSHSNLYKLFAKGNLKLSLLEKISMITNVPVTDIINGTHMEHESMAFVVTSGGSGSHFTRISDLKMEIETLEGKITDLGDRLIEKEKYIEALENINEKTKLLKEYEDKEEIITFQEFLDYMNRPKEDIVGLFIEYLEWKKNKLKN